MDLRLPGKDGFETARAIRKDGNHVPIIAISAYPVNSDWQRCTEAGIDDALCKGFQLEELARVIKLWANSDIVKPLFDERRMQKLMATAG
jgi:CheY-like chemotaxis protein